MEKDKSYIIRKQAEFEWNFLRKLEPLNQWHQLKDMPDGERTPEVPPRRMTMVPR